MGLFNTLCSSAVVTLLAFSSVTGRAENYPKRLARADSFLGVHYDFHAGEDCKEIGKNTTREMVENIIRQIKPDYLQIDCKGHRGLSSYPTKVGNPAPGFVGGDPLKLWRQVTAENGVALYMHYSGVWDSEAIRQHPTWGAIEANGKTNGNATSFYSPYADQLLIPQLRELAGVYGVDGAWVDGECWASIPDYGPAALANFQKQTGYTEIPRKREDRRWLSFLEFNRENFRRYLRHYIEEVKKTNPEFQLCSNWAFTDHMPEPVSLPVDFISGDYSPEDSVNSARLSARYLTRQGKPWDLMAWSFSQKPGKNGSTEKTAVQLQREAAVVLALGGGFQAYFRQKRDGSVFDERVPVMAEVAKFCRARQAICHHAVQVPQVAVLYSTPAHYRNIGGLFSRDPSPFQGTLEAIIESRLPVELLGEHHLEGRLKQYPLIVVPEWDYLDPQFQTELVKFVREGGQLLLVGPRTSALFQSELAVTVEGQPLTVPRFLQHNGAFVSVKGSSQPVSFDPKGKVKSFGKIHTTNDVASVSQPAATISKLGKGRIAAVWFSFSRGYLENHSEISRQFIADLAKQLFPKPLVEVKGDAPVEVVVNRINGKLAVNLVNTGGPHRTEPIIENIAPTGRFELTIRDTGKPKRVLLEPGARTADYSYRNGELHVIVPSVEIHDIVTVE